MSAPAWTRDPVLPWWGVARGRGTGEFFPGVCPGIRRFDIHQSACFLWPPSDSRSGPWKGDWGGRAVGSISISRRRIA